MRVSPDFLARPFVAFVERFYPDSFVFAILLTGVTFALAIGLTETSSGEALVIWGDGLKGLLPFITQIALTLLCAHSLAHTDLVHGALDRMARWPRTERQAYAWVAIVAGVGSLIAWSLGLVVGALIALGVARAGRARGLRLHFPLLVASAYAGFVVWHMGYSSSAALFVATPGHALESMTGVIPVTETIFASWNLALAVLTVAAVACVCAGLAPRKTAASEWVEPGTAPEPGEPDRSTLGRRLEHARWISSGMGALLLAYLFTWFRSRGLELTLDVVNWSFLGLGLVLARSPIHYVALIRGASRTLGPIILQYPFYAGIMALMTGTSLVHLFSDGFVALASPETLGFWAFVSGGALNFFVPSGGGQWAVQGPIFIEAAQKLGVAAPVVVMGVAYGDQWTNLIQPFWTLPLLAIAGLNSRAIMGYCFVVFLVTFVLFGGGLLLVGSGV
ncbi:MAG: short-chain fatty acid transporter [Deltaproteobacteria bacterium]|nr:short-chain fatty acid transporter [Deltaproteobacteria bacterium]MBW2392736.1 short-chain fatty acid transporter [Deltaproteobacteria bacterium]